MEVTESALTGMPTIAHNKPDRKKSLLLFTMATLLIVSGLSAFGWSWLVRNDEYQYTQATAAVDKLRSQRDFSGAVSTLDVYLSGWGPHAHRYEAIISKGTVLETAGDYQAALAAYRVAETVNLDRKEPRAETKAIARVSERVGDIPTAIDYYQKTLDQVDPKAFDGPSNIKWLKDKIADLKRRNGQSNAS